MIAAVNRALKPDGRLVVVEYAEGHPFGPLDKTERMTEGQIRSEIEPGGFELDRVLDIVPIQHCLIFTKTNSGIASGDTEPLARPAKNLQRPRQLFGAMR